MGCFAGRRLLDFPSVCCLFLGSIIFVLFVFTLIVAGAAAADEAPAEADGAVSEAPQDTSSIAAKEDSPLYVPGEIVVRFKDGKTPEDARELNAKYRVVSWEKVFEGIPSPRNVLDDLKKKLSALNDKDSQGWYWQLDKNSPEYKAYLEKEEMEKRDLRDRIRMQEDMLAYTEPEHDQAARDAINSGMENLYFLKSEDPGTDILSMAAEYRLHPSVESTEPNYIAKVQ